jgi:hypothetical protein
VSDYDNYGLMDWQTGKPRLLSEQCSTCVGRPGNLMHLRPGKLKELIEANIGPSMGLICHQTLSYGDHPEYGDALCRWFYDTYGPQCNGVRVMLRLCGEFTEVPPPPPEEDGHGPAAD